jgi:hypothetical protein
MSIQVAQPYKKRPRKDTRPSRSPEARRLHYEEHREEIVEQHAIQRQRRKNLARRELYKVGIKHKPVIVHFPDVSLPIEISMTEFQKYRKDYFALGAEVVVKGERLVEQLELL